MVKIAFALVGVALADEWDDFKNQYNKVYNGDDEESQRRAIFESNLKLINSENSKGHSYTLGVGPFADLTSEEFKSGMLGFKKPESDLPTVGVQKYSGANLPDSIDWVEKGAVTPVKNQGQCGSCWAFSTVGALEGRAQLAKNTLVSMSEQELVDCDQVDNGCHGGLMDNGFKYVEQNGLCTEDSYGYKAQVGSCASSSCTKTVKAGEVTGYQDVDSSEEALAEAVAQGPVSVAVEADTLFQHYQGGVMTGTCGSQLDHGVLVVGYGEDNGTKYWKVKNSWGSSWGEDGYLRLQKGKGGQGECGILSSASYPVLGSSVVV